MLRSAPDIATSLAHRGWYQTSPVNGNGVHPALSLRTHKDSRLRKHADYQRVYQQSRKHFSPSMTYFFATRAADPRAADPRADISAGVRRPAPAGPRVGLTAGRVLGKAVDRNRIKRRMRALVGANLALLQHDVDVILHPRRLVMTAPFGSLQEEVSRIFATVEKTLGRMNSRAEKTHA